MKVKMKRKEFCYEKIKKSFVKMFLGDMYFLEEEYEKLFGTQQQRRAEKEIHENKKKIMLVLIAFIILTLAGGFMLWEGKKIYLYGTSGDGYIQGIKRPKTGAIQEKLLAEIHLENEVMYIPIPARVPNLETLEKRETEGRDQKREERQSIIRTQLNSLLKQEEKSGESVYQLPDRTQEGYQILWKTPKNNNPLYIFLMMLLLMSILWSYRYQTLKKEKRIAEESLKYEIPLFVNQMVLLLNAGLIFETAFLEITRKNRQRNVNTYFSQQLDLIATRYEETQAPLEQQLNLFARRTEKRDFIKISGIVLDNLHKGTKLSEKLQRERSFLWQERQKDTEEKIRMNETKLTLPLCIHLLVLIAISMAPAIIIS